MMKVRLSASRQPYMRAGIAIGARGVFTILERDKVNAEQWLALLSDPVVQVALSSDDGATWFSPTPEEREKAIASVKEAVTPLSSPMLPDLDAVFAATGTSSVTELDARIALLLEIEADQEAELLRIQELGFPSLSALIQAFAGNSSELASLKAAAEQNMTADRQGGAPAEVVPPPAGDGEGQGAAEGDKTAAPADQAEKSAPAGKAKPARKTHTKPAGE